ncbi:AIPR family protein [Aeromonas hydrophila]
MAFVKDLQASDNAVPAIATSQIVAQRLGKALREKFQEHIHKRECLPEQKDYDIKMSSRAIAAFVIYNLATVDDVVAGMSVCDSSDDGGIDAICVNHSEKVVVIVQSKFNQSGNNTWNKTDFLSFKDACERLQLGEYHRFDLILQKMTADIEVGLNSQDYKFMFVMAHTGKRGAAEIILKDMQEWQDELNDAALVTPNTQQDQLPFQVHLVSAEDLTEWMQKGSHLNIDLEDVELDNYGQKSTPYLAFYGQVSGDQILEWWTSHGTRLFSKNIRNILGQTDVNDSIKLTSLNSPEMFWYYNNGITLLVSDIHPHRRNANRSTERGSFKFINASVINGAQTVSTIGQLFSNASPEDLAKLSQLRVPARFIKVPDIDNADVAVAITKANNHQNRVLGRDFASQHPEQLRLAKEMAVESYQYQLLRTAEQKKSTDAKVIDLDEALDGLSCLNGSASIITTLKSQRGRFFDNLDGSLYKSLFNPSVSGIKVINAVIHLRSIEKLINEKLLLTDKNNQRKRHLIITHANRVISSLLLDNVSRISKATELVDVNEGALSEKLDDLVVKMERYIEEYHVNAYPARFFANVEKVSEIMKYLAD